jgi:hypothetical protein
MSVTIKASTGRHFLFCGDKANFSPDFRIILMSAHGFKN